MLFALILTIILGSQACDLSRSNRQFTDETGVLWDCSSTHCQIIRDCEAQCCASEVKEDVKRSAKSGVSSLVVAMTGMGMGFILLFTGIIMYILSRKNSASMDTADVERKMDADQDEPIGESPQSKSENSMEEQLLADQWADPGPSNDASEFQPLEQLGDENCEILTNCIVSQESDGDEISLQKEKLQETKF